MKASSIKVNFRGKDCANREKYEGQFHKGELQGKGLFAYKNGDNYFGHFGRNERRGYGVLDFENGDYYHGAWEKNRMNGIGYFKKAPTGNEIGLGLLKQAFLKKKGVDSKTKKGWEYRPQFHPKLIRLPSFLEKEGR